MGQKVRRRGLYDHCKAIGWDVDTYRRAQISVNLTDYKQTAPHTVLEAARGLAAERGLVVTGSEIVGLVPFQCLLASGRHYLKAMGKSTGVPTSDILQTAVFSMGLGDVAPFEVEKKVLGLPTYDPKALVSMPVHAFTDEVSRDTPAPGGGSIAALAGSLGAALASMVANLAQGGPERRRTPSSSPWPKRPRRSRTASWWLWTRTPTPSTPSWTPAACRTPHPSRRPPATRPCRPG